MNAVLFLVVAVISLVITCGIVFVILLALLYLARVAKSLVNFKRSA